jgi:putative transposase
MPNQATNPLFHNKTLKSAVQILDFGHAPIFADADVFPCIVSDRTLVGQASSLLSQAVRTLVGQASSLLSQTVSESGGRFEDGSRQDACTTGELSQDSKLSIQKRQLPHWERDGSVYFITFKTWEKLELNEAARKVVLNACQFFDNQRYITFAVVVMPDHVHWLVQPLPKPTGEYWALGEIMHSIKSYSAKQTAKVMKHIGTVWQTEQYDRIIRNEEEFRNTWEYIRQNPVKAGLSHTPESYPFFWQQDSVGQASSLQSSSSGESRQDANITQPVGQASSLQSSSSGESR